MGFFKLGERIVAVVLRIGQDKQRYSFEALEGTASLGKREVAYYDYFTESGVFLSFKLRKVLEEWVEEIQKGSK